MSNITIVTGKRGGYESVRPLARDLISLGNDVIFFATDQHLDRDSGFTVDTIRSDFGSDRVYAFDMMQRSRNILERTKSVARCHSGFAEYLENRNVDAVILFGDRSEVLACAHACLYHDVILFHIQGGDTSGCVDDRTRHAITQLSHYHLVSNQHSADVVMRQGNCSQTVFDIGDLHVDEILKGQIANIDLALTELSLSRPFIISLFHPDTDNRSNWLEDAIQYFAGVENYCNKANTCVLLVEPCSDPGSDIVLRELHACAARLGNLASVTKNVKAESFRSLLKATRALVGNSSCGIVESAYTETPVVNVGNRQQGRLCPPHVTHCGVDARAIANRLCSLSSHPPVHNYQRLYGDGDISLSMAHKIHSVLSNHSISSRKRFSW